jgi:hypothetical protein
MIKHIVILFKILFKMSDSLYMLNVQVEVISLDTQSSLVTSRDYNHIRWFCRNSVSVSLFATKRSSSHQITSFLFIQSSITVECQFRVQKMNKKKKISFVEKFSNNAIWEFRSFLKKLKWWKKSFAISVLCESVANNDIETELRQNHVIWLQSRDVIKIIMYRANNFDLST